MPVGKHYGWRVGHFGLLRVGAELSFLHYCENRSNPSFKADAVKRCMFPEVFSARRLTQTLEVIRLKVGSLLSEAFLLRSERKFSRTFRKPLIPGKLQVVRAL